MSVGCFIRQCLILACFDCLGRNGPLGGSLSYDVVCRDWKGALNEIETSGMYTGEEGHLSATIPLLSALIPIQSQILSLGNRAVLPNLRGLREA